MLTPLTFQKKVFMFHSVASDLSSTEADTKPRLRPILPLSVTHLVEELAAYPSNNSSDNSSVTRTVQVIMITLLRKIVNLD